VPAADNPFGLAVDERTRTLYAPLLGDGEKPGAVAVVDLRHCHAGDTSGCGRNPAIAPAGFGSLGVAVDPRSHAVYVTNDEDASVSVIDGRSCRAATTSGCGRTPTYLPTDDYPTASIALAPSFRTAYVASFSQGSVSLVPMRR
jgi:DNA-binding beta-propeller fold protein YncE